MVRWLSLVRLLHGPTHNKNNYSSVSIKSFSKQWYPIKCRSMQKDLWAVWRALSCQSSPDLLRTTVGYYHPPDLDASSDTHCTQDQLVWWCGKSQSTVPTCMYVGCQGVRRLNSCFHLCQLQPQTGTDKFHKDRQDM